MLKYLRLSDWLGKNVRGRITAVAGVLAKSMTCLLTVCQLTASSYTGDLQRFMTNDPLTVDGLYWIINYTLTVSAESKEKDRQKFTSLLTVRYCVLTYWCACAKLHYVECFCLLSVCSFDFIFLVLISCRHTWSLHNPSIFLVVHSSVCDQCVLKVWLKNKDRQKDKKTDSDRVGHKQNFTFSLRWMMWYRSQEGRLDTNKPLKPCSSNSSSLDPLVEAGQNYRISFHFSW